MIHYVSHIRLLANSTLHDAGTILGVTRHHNHAANSHYLVHHTHAQGMVAMGHAEWVEAVPTAAPVRETHEQMEARHMEERADMHSRLGTEDSALKDRQQLERDVALAATGAATIITGGI